MIVELAINSESIPNISPTIMGLTPKGARAFINRTDLEDSSNQGNFSIKKVASIQTPSRRIRKGKSDPTVFNDFLNERDNPTQKRIRGIAIEPKKPVKLISQEGISTFVIPTDIPIKIEERIGMRL